MSTLRADLPAITIRRGPEALTVVRALARLVLVGGLVVGGFVGYQFGVTSFFANRAQANLQADLEVRRASAPVVSVPFVAVDRPAAPFSVPAVAFDPASVPGLDPTALAPLVAAVDTPVPTPESSESAVLLTESAPALGDSVGRIVIPAAGVDWAFVEGVSRSALKSGAGHMPGTALPGQPGNAVISGHRTTYGAPFLHLDRLAVGDPIVVETAVGTHVYQVVDSFVVDPGDVWVTGQWDGAWLTLTTCEPVLSSAQRLVVVATLVAGPNAGVILGGS